MENTKKIIYCRFCDQLTVEEVEVINSKSIVWMLHMKRYLMWAKLNLVTFSNLQLYCEKVAKSITG